MSDLTALQILASINKLASEIKLITPPLEQPFWRQPWIGAIAGVIIGFSLNAVKEKFTISSLINKKIKCMEIEAQQIMETSKVGVKFCIEFYSDFDNDNVERITVTLPPESVSFCFDRFYPDVVMNISEVRVRNLVLTYKHLDYVHSIRKEFIKKMSETSLSNKEKSNYIDVIFQAYIQCYYSAKCFINSDENKQFNNLEVINDMEIVHPYLDFMNKINKEIGS